MAAVQNEPPFGFQFIEAARVHEVLGRGIHGRLIRGVSASAPLSKGVPRMSIRSHDIAIHLAGEGTDVVAPG